MNKSRFMITPLLFACVLQMCFDSVLVAQDTIYYESGRINKIVSGSQIVYYYDNNMNFIRERFECTSCNEDSAWVASGRYEFYSSQGRLLRRGHYANGRRDGRWLMYSDTDVLVCINNYLNDSLHGQQVMFDDLGVLISTSSFVKNIENGMRVNFFPDGTIESFGMVKNNARIGIWIFYYDKGEIKQKGMYSGKFLYSKLDRDLWKIVIIDQDSIEIDKSMYSRHVIEEVERTADTTVHLKIGKWEVFNRTGDVILEGSYDGFGNFAPRSR